MTTRSKRIGAGIVWLLFWIGISLVRSWPLSTEGWASLVPLRCPLSWLFDLQCPTCGLGRSLVAAAFFHGRESWHFHPLGLPLFWGAQGLWLYGLLRPEALKLRMAQGKNLLLRQQPLLWVLLALYSLWGFCWRAPL